MICDRWTHGDNIPAEVMRSHAVVLLSHVMMILQLVIWKLPPIVGTVCGQC